MRKQASKRGISSGEGVSDCVVPGKSPLETQKSPKSKQRKLANKANSGDNNKRSVSKRLNYEMEASKEVKAGPSAEAVSEANACVDKQLNKQEYSMGRRNSTAKDLSSKNVASSTEIEQNVNDGIEVKVDEEELDYLDVEPIEQIVQDDEVSDVESEQSVQIRQLTNEEKEAMKEQEYLGLMEELGFQKVFNKLFTKRMQTMTHEERQAFLADTESEQRGKEGFNNNSQKNNKVKKISAGNTENKSKTLQAVKSPSDTTLYTPALKKVVDQGMVDRISDFVEAIRLEGTVRTVDQRASPIAGMSQRHDEGRVPVGRPELDSVRAKTQQTILDAEKFKATIEPVPGMFDENGILCEQQNFGKVNLMNNGMAVGNGFSDDDFFHLTCHIDVSLRSKIEKGDFVDLEKLLPKDKRRYSDDTRLEWVNRDGSTYLAPVSDREHKITGIHRWDQAFWVYATICCGANPSRSQEIWQYVSVINTAAASYSWENVSSYDYTFRHLMEFNPKRSWATTYNQMWNLSMRDPLPKNIHYHKMYQGGSGYSNTGNRNASSTGEGATAAAVLGKKRKADYCKNFNKGLVCRYGKKCRFTERCSICNSADHPIIKCPQLFNKSDDSK